MSYFSSRSSFSSDAMATIQTAALDTMNAFFHPVESTTNLIVSARTTYPLFLMFFFCLRGILQYRAMCTIAAIVPMRVSGPKISGGLVEIIVCFFFFCYPGSIISEIIFQNITPRCLENFTLFTVYISLFLLISILPFIGNLFSRNTVRMIVEFIFLVDLTRYSLLTFERAHSVSLAASIWSSLTFQAAGPILRMMLTRKYQVPAMPVLMNLSLLAGYFGIHKYYYLCTTTLDVCANARVNAFVIASCIPAALYVIEQSPVGSHVTRFIRRRNLLSRFFGTWNEVTYTSYWFPGSEDSSSSPRGKAEGAIGRANDFISNVVEGFGGPKNVKKRK